MVNKNYFIAIYLFLLVLGINAKAQTENIKADSIHYESSFLHYKYFANGHKISSEEVLELMPDSTLIYDNFSSANNACVFGYILGFSGVSLMVVPAVMSLFGNNKAWSIAYAGAGMALVSVPLFIKHKTQIPKAIDYYNQTLDKRTTQSKVQLNFGISSSGIGFCLRF